MNHFWQKNGFLWAVYLLAAVGAAAQKLAQGKGPNGYTAYENYLIFKNAFPHLLAGENPYAAWPGETWDLFKYSPTFALCMAPFSALPDWLGLPLWNVLNAGVLLFAILQMPVLTAPQRRFFGWFVAPELFICLQNSQSNALVAGCMLLTFNALERGQAARAALPAVAAGFVKIFGTFAAPLCWLYPRGKFFLGWLVVWGIVLAVLPLLAVSPEQLKTLYGWWLEMLRQDHGASVGLSVMGWLETWFGWSPPKVWVTTVGLFLLAASILAATFENRLLAWASVLIWVVIFNHRAESPTFVIALCGVALWFFSGEKRGWEKVLFWSAFVLSSLSPTDLFPKMLRENLVQPYTLKATGCIIIWLLITYKLFRYNKWIHWTKHL